MKNKEQPTIVVKLLLMYSSNYILNRNLGSPPELAWLQSQAGTGMAIMAMLSLVLLYSIKALGMPQYKTFSLVIAAAMSCIPIYYANFVFDARRYALEREKHKSKPNYFIITFEVVCILLMVPILIGF